MPYVGRYQLPMLALSADFVVNILLEDSILLFNEEIHDTRKSKGLKKIFSGVLL